ncbi:Gldg family protein [Desulfovibrio inopinatus]|uniref:Gldg family protein n=1 Tax=Desulfovibrio inopinatus TaxID=102109 RepID=UPI0004180CCC|nr:Gldg family protein [Desulfovibrio inopinatus]
MHDMWTIFKRELSAYFNSAVGYIFLIVFLIINAGIFVTGFFQFPLAEMRPFFAILPVTLCVFIPAVTMRLWAEERSENTVEMLLTFPMRPLSIVLGKFMAGFIFYLLALVGTGMIPIMLLALGHPDVGQILCSYLGASLLGAFFISLGLLISGFSRDQIVAFVVSLLACFGFYLLGTDFIAAALDAWVAGFGGFLRDLVGATGHYLVFTKGVFETADLLYFLVWTGLFLFLNGLFIEGRNRKTATMTFSVACLLCLVIGVLFNALVTDASLGRIDMTEGAIHTISPASKRILANLKAPVQVTYYVTPSEDMPTEMQNLERDVLDILQELRVASGNRFQFKRVHMQAANVLRQNPADKPDADPLEQRMLQKGVEPFSVQAMRETGAVTNLVYSSLGIAYKDNDEEILPQIVPQNVGQLEYNLISTIYRLERDKPAKIGVFSSKPFQLLNNYLAHEKYEVVPFGITKSSPIPADADALLVLEPRSLSDRQQYELARALASGRKILMAVQDNVWDYNIMQGALNITRIPVTPNVNPLLAHYGLGIDQNVLMDESNTGIRMARNQIEQLFGGGLDLKLPIQILIDRESMNKTDPITARLSQFLYMWGSALTINQEELEKNALTATILASTSPNAWTVTPQQRLTQEDITPPAASKRKAYPVLARITGQFPDVTKDQTPPAWNDPQIQEGASEPETVQPITPAPGELYLVGCSELFSDDFLAASLDLVLNIVDSMALGPDLITIRGKKAINRMIPNVSPEAAALWKIINYGLVPLCIAIIGILRTMSRRRRRARYAEDMCKV